MENSNKNLDFSKQRLLVIAPHPDDETLGCGGTISKIKAAGGKVYVLIMTLGDVEQFGGESKTDVRKEEMEKAMKFLEVDGYDFGFVGDKYHLRLDTMPQKDLIDFLEKKIDEIKPTIVALPTICSANQDHIAIFKAAFTAARPRPSKLKHSPDLIISYEVPSSWWDYRQSFNPNFFVDISDHLEKKIKALSFFASQIRQGPDPRSLENVQRIAEFRGEELCLKSAEAFICHRCLI